MSSKKPDPAQQELAREQAYNMRRSQMLQEQVWNQAQQDATVDRQRSTEQYEFNRGLQEEARARDKFFFDRYKNTTMRQEDEFLRRVDEFDTEETQGRLARRGLADVQQGMLSARRAGNDMLRRRGVNIASARSVGSMAGLDVAQAGAEASAFSTAAEAARREGMTLRTVATGLGNPLGASDGYQRTSSAFGGAALGASGRPLDWSTGMVGQFGSQSVNAGNGANAAFDSMARNRGSGGFNWSNAISSGAAAGGSTGNWYAAALAAMVGGFGGGR